MANKDYNFNSFIEFANRFGLSINNTFEIDYNFNETNGVDRAITNIIGDSYKDHLKFFVEDAEIPNVSMGTGDYRYNNSPQFKYPYMKVFNEVTIGYYLDSTLNQKKIFDIWFDYIYNMSNNPNYSYPSAASRSEFGAVNNRLMRVPYKNDYVANITIKKFDKFFRCGDRVDNLVLSTPTDVRDAVLDDNNVRYSVTLVNAFPVNVSPVTLSNAASDLTRFSVTFEYDILRENATYGTSSLSPTTNGFYIP